MSTFYETLEVSEQATPEQIRRAYRRLVLLTHPDRTPDPAAHERYLAINAAYDVLSQPARRQLYDAALAIRRRPVAPLAPAAAVGSASSRDRARARRRYPAAPPPGPRPDPYAHIYARYAPWGQRFCQLMLVFCSLLLLDCCLTREYRGEQVQTVERHSMSSRRSGSVTYYTFRTPHARFRSYDYDWARGTLLTIRRSALFGQIREVGVQGQVLQPADRVSIYGNFFFAPLLLAVLAAVGAWPRASHALVLNCSVGAGLLLLVVFYFLYSS
ncbi:J domain-containing protein [Hymenobacter sp. HSC-4F20]|uniref:J domain-containing protein n=1 Tax=Hymenobacter sp. HSC-4F20 TaxID=2864135 RepID=UPI001C73657E|nr:J domain-containing protein [Hymenobacter sp. HSC-4F20]MBX0291383.1 J domain-containing protein [Hymenobacter sp. HSC-4F20]